MLHPFCAWLFSFSCNCNHKKKGDSAYRVNHVNKTTGVTYVYEVVSFWDKKKKQSRNKQVCVGKLDSVSGEFIPSKRLEPKQAAVRDPAVTASAEIVGPSIVLDAITRQLDLGKLLKACFPEEHSTSWRPTASCNR